ncbi:hypothetical protein R83H12_00941 [Fibrobacteria bacterium R8-3-H12]
MENNAEKQDFNTLSRYTTWSSFKYWLEKSVILFGNYTHWEDKSDVTLLDAYAKHIKKQVRAICLMDRSDDASDCYYCWKNYTNKSNDVIRIDFNKNMLRNTLKDNEEVKIYGNPIQYPSYKEIENFTKEPKNIPFIKRVSYKGEREFRFLCIVNSTEIKKDYAYEYMVGEDFFKNCIKGIRFSPSIHSENLLKIKSILDKYHIEKNIYHTKIFGYGKWETMVLKNLGKK